MSQASIHFVTLEDVDWHTYLESTRIHASALVILAASLCCSFSIVMLSFILGRTKTIGHRIPIYLGICDAMASGVHMVDHVYSVVNRHPFPPAGCSAIAAIFSFWLSCTLFLVTSMAISIYFSICRHHVLDYGRHDWKLIGLVLLGATGMTSFGLGIQAYGSSGYWCYIDPFSPHGMWANSFYHLTMPLIVLCICFVCYSLTFRKMYRNSQALRDSEVTAFGGYGRGSRSSAAPKTRFFRLFRPKDSGTSSLKGDIDSLPASLPSTPHRPSSNSDRALQVQWRITKHISAYVFIFIFQWFPIVVFVCYMLTMWDKKDLPNCTVALFNTAGVLHLVVYLWNLRDREGDGAPNNLRVERFDHSASDTFRSTSTASRSGV